MAKQVTHLSRIIERKTHTVTTTLCNRMSNASADGWNCTDVDADVTCKFCLRRMSSTIRRSAA